MDGVEFLRHLAAREFRGGIAILSGEERRTLDVVDNLAQAHELNYLGALQKPITGQSIKDLLDSFSRAAAQTKVVAKPDVVPVSVDEIRTGLEKHQFDVMF